MIKIWSMKKDEESAKKKKPKTSPAQLRVQKGGYRICCLKFGELSKSDMRADYETSALDFDRPHGAGVAEYNEDRVPRSTGLAELFPYHRPR